MPALLQTAAPAAKAPAAKVTAIAVVAANASLTTASPLKRCRQRKMDSWDLYFTGETMYLMSVAYFVANIFLPTEHAGVEENIRMYACTVTDRGSRR